MLKINAPQYRQKKRSNLDIMPPTWPTSITLYAIIIIFCLLVFRLSVKSDSLNDSDIINHYSDVYLERELIEGRSASRTDCYALALNSLFTRLEVICEPLGAKLYRYIIGHWGQLLSLRRGLRLRQDHRV